MPTTILQLVSTFQTKTDTKWLVRLLPRIDRRRFTMAVAAFYDDGPARTQLEQADISCYCFHAPRVIDPRSLVAPVRLIKRLGVDIVHTHLLRADLFGGLACALTKTPLVSTVYAYGGYRRAKRRPIVDRILDKLATRRPGRFVAVCESIKEDLINRLGISESKVTVIHTGIDPIVVAADRASDAAARYALPSDRPMVLVPARLSYEKGVDCFIRAVRCIVDRHVPARFVIAGTGPMREQLQALTDRLGLSQHICFVGFVDPIEELIAACDIVVLPSYAEGLPNAALEAFAVGRPLVASAVGGLLDLAWYDPQAVVLFEPNNPTDLAENLIKLLTDPSFAHTTAGAGERIIKDHLNTRSVAKAYEQLYSQVKQQSPNV